MPRSTRAPTWSASCSFRRRRGISRWIRRASSARQVKRRASKVALTVDADDATLAGIVEVLQPDMLQLHGTETPARVAEIKRKYGREVMKALPVESKADLAVAVVLCRRLRPHPVRRRAAQGRDAAGRPRRGCSTGVLLENLDLELPFMLSGGLDAGNVAEAVRITRAGGVDVSSGVERAPGDQGSRHDPRFHPRACAPTPARV